MSNKDSLSEAGGGVSAGVAAGGEDDAPSAAELAELAEVVRSADQLMARAVSLAGRLAGSGVCERAEGLPLELFLGMVGRLTGADRAVLVTAGETLRDLPTVAELFRAGRLSWGQVRSVVDEAKRLSKAGRGVVDARVAATVAAYEGAEAFEPDELVWAVADAAAEARSARAEERAEARRAQRDFVSVQSDFDGGVRVYAELGPVAGAGLVNALDAAADTPAGTGGPADADAVGDPGGRAGDGDFAGDAAGAHGDHAGDGRSAGDAAGAHGEHVGDGDAAGPTGAGEDQDDEWVGVWSSRARSRQFAAALERICADWLGGGDRDHPRPARPLLVGHVDVSSLAADHVGGTIQLGVRGGLARITAATAEALAASGDVRAVVFDGARPLAATGKVNAADIPDLTRLAVQARDRGCRFPGSRDPVSHSDVHHLRERHDGGGHHPDNLVLMSRRYHTMLARRGWTLTLHPSTGKLTARRGARVIHSLPKGTRLAHPANAPPGEGEDNARAGPEPAAHDTPPDRARPHPGQLPF